MNKNIITVDELPVFGPYSAAVEANDFIFISGQIPLNPATGKIIDEIKTATKQVLTNIQTILRRAGLEMTNVLKTTIFLTNMADFSAVNEIYADFFPQDAPARSAVEVSALPKGALIEIEAIATRR